MEQLVRISEINEQKVVSAFDLYKALGYDSNHFARWKNKNTIQNKHAVKGLDWVELHNDDNNSPNRVRKIADCAFSIDFAKKVCMAANTEIGEKVRCYFIEVEKNSQNNNALKLLRQHFEIKKRLEDYKEARKAANRLVYCTKLELQQNENNMLCLLHGVDSSDVTSIKQPQQKTLFD